MPLADILGQRFSRVSVTHRVPAKNGRSARWACICDCGTAFETDGLNLRKGLTKSCGCLQQEIVKKMFTTHGEWRSPAYTTWDSMIQRCTNPNSTRWKFYGGRGIKICESWLFFENFLADMGERPKGKTLDRFPDMNGNYEPNNCRWANPEEQHNNTRGNHFVEHEGERLTISQLARKVGVYPELLASRLQHGWSMERAINTVPRIYKKK